MIGVAIGGFFGAIVRYLVYLAIEQSDRHKKWATFSVNSIGSFLTGLSLSTSEFWMTGFLGAFTTFSTFALDAVKELQNGKIILTVFYISATLLAGLGLFTIGFIISQ
ncbi:fluoride efflux transporter FluC [Planococcus lenghuensis]|nr:CrcB family protein [Planococcus lenghuensis]